MGKTFAEKIINGHLLYGELSPGREIAIRIDQTLTQDATGTMAYLAFESMGISKVQTELSVSYIDHNTIQSGFENADDHRYLQSVAAKYGIILSRAGNGICHQVHLERFGKPGKTLIGSDSHTPTGGALGMLAIGAGGLDVALAMAGKPFYFTAPKTIKINLTGKLNPWVSAKDIILKVLEIFATRGNVGFVFEYSGEGTASLTVPERATIANMGAECGVTASIFPSDEMTRQFLHAQDREKEWIELSADPDAVYDLIVDVDLSQLVPLAAKPHSPDHVSVVRDIGPTAVHQICMGSCTNSSYRDLAMVAEILKNKKVHPGVSFIIAPGSLQVLLNLDRDGYLIHLLAAGARLMENACGFCIGSSQSPPSGGVSLRTSNRNFFGRSGTRDAQIYLVSPETAAASVITGHLTDPRDLGITYPEIHLPDRFLIDDCMILYPETEGNPSNIEITRGPNIGAPPRSEPMPESILGIVSLKVGDKITTDHIIPAGERMKYRSNIPEYSEFVFENVDHGFAERAMMIRDSGRYNIIVAGFSYGQGSSREHAAICPMYLGVKAVIAKSFERIHAANLVNFGIIPLTFSEEKDYDSIDQEDAIEMNDIGKAMKEGAFVVRNLTKGKTFAANLQLSERQKAVLLAGGALNIR